MQKSIFKTICAFTLVFFVMSLTGAAACNGGSCSASKIDAKNDKFTVTSNNKSFNVLKNDKGQGLKVKTTGYIKTAKGGKVYMQSNGTFKYVKKVNCSSGTDSFSYKAVDKYKKTDTAKVTLYLTCGASK